MRRWKICEFQTSSPLLPRKLTWNWKITPLKRKIIFQTSVLGFHVSFRGCKSMVVELVPVKGGMGSKVHPPIGRKNATYITLIVLAEPGGLYATYHLLREPETTID